MKKQPMPSIIIAIGGMSKPAPSQQQAPKSPQGATKIRGCGAATKGTMARGPMA